MESKGIKLGGHNIAVNARQYSTEKDHKQAIKDIERVLLILSQDSVDEIIMALAPYRLKSAKAYNKYRAELDQYGIEKYGTD